MSDDESRHEHPPTAGEPNFSENGSETMENDQTGLPPGAAALTANLHESFAPQLEQVRSEHVRSIAYISHGEPAGFGSSLLHLGEQP